MKLNLDHWPLLALFAPIIFLALLCSLPVTALAASVTVVDDITAFRSDMTSAQSIVLRYYNTLGDGGGGIFTKNDGTSCPDDGGVVVLTSSGANDCYYRQFSGAVHLSWYGVADAASHGCYAATPAFSGCDATGTVQKALAAAQVSAGFGGNGVVTTDNRSIAIMNQCSGCDTGVGILIPTDEYLTCDGPPGVARGQSGGGAEPPATPYYQLAHSIVLGPGLTIMRQDQTRHSSCVIRPSWYVPQSTDDGAPFNIPAQSLRDIVQMTRQFKGTATTCAGRACNMDNMFILGFDTCDDCGGHECVHWPWENIVEMCSHRETL